MVAYTGIETVSNMAEEARDFGKTIPRGIGLVVGAVAVIYSFLPAIALSAMPVVNGETQLALPKEQGGYADDPVLGVVENMDLGALQHPAEIYVGILAATILFIATNAGLIGVSRLTYSMGQHRQLPELLRVLHPKFRTPYVAIIVFGLVACVAILPGQADFLGVDLRVRGDALVHDGAPRADQAAGQPSRGRATVAQPGRDPLQRGTTCPRLAIFGGLGTGTRADRRHRARRARAGLRAAVAGVGHRHLRRLPAQAGAVADRDGQDRHARSPRSSTRSSTSRSWSRSRTTDSRPEAVATAVRLAAMRRRGIHVLVTITVPPNSPIDAPLPEQEARAASLIDSARVRGGRRVTGHWEKVRPGGAGRRIVEEAREIRARALVMSLPPERAGGSLFGKTLETVLTERPVPGDHQLVARRRRAPQRQLNGRPDAVRVPSFAPCNAPTPRRRAC